VNFSAFNLGTAIALALLAKILFVGVTSIGEAVGMAVILGSFPLAKVIDHLFPKRPDLFAEMRGLQSQMNKMIEEKDEMQRDLTALKFRDVRK
jgi:hypothetical protein